MNKIQKHGGMSRGSIVNKYYKINSTLVITEEGCDWITKGMLVGSRSVYYIALFIVPELFINNLLTYLLRYVLCDLFVKHL